ncbi:MAG: M23 family metallopeptidase [Candidatus Limnocylindrales bacterium]
MVIQGNGAGHTGWEAFAWDFAVFGSTAEFPVVAARGGTVVGLEAGYKTSQHCQDDSCWTVANYVLIDQGDKTSALYLHLAEGSLKVVLGQKVTQGQPLGDADNTGWSTGNHLHFQVEQTPSQVVLDQARAGKAADGWWFRPSISVGFLDPSVLARDPSGIPTPRDSYPGGYVSSNGGAQTPTQPSAGAAKPGGTWISPTAGSEQLGTIHASVHAYPSKAGDSAIDHVSFTVWWPAIGSKSGPWKTACSVKQPTSGDEYDCDFDPGRLGAPTGQLWLSFDVYDASGGSNLSPNGERSVDWAQPDVVVADGWQTFQGDGYVVDYPGTAVSQSIPSSSTYGLYSGSVSYYEDGPSTDPEVVYLVEHLVFPTSLDTSGFDYVDLLKGLLSYYSFSSSDVAVTQRDVTVDGHRGLDISMQGNGTYAECEVIVSGAHMYLVMAAHYTSDTTLDAPRFFQSFRLS